MLQKKFFYTIRNWMMILMQNLIPISFLVIGMAVTRSLNRKHALPALEISLGTYERTITILDVNENVTDTSFLHRYFEIFGNLAKQS